MRRNEVTPTRKVTAAVATGVGAALVLGAGATYYVVRNRTYWKCARRTLRKAGFVEKNVAIDGATINYAEGPDNGPPLLLIHGQMVDWTTYMRVLADLAQDFHVYVVDCYGHGRSDRAPERYSNVAMGRDLAAFLRTVIAEPAFVSGNSSGGLLGIQIANEAPGLVRALILEDPPLFSSLHPRFSSTAGYDLPRLAHEFLASHETDFPSFYVAHTAFLGFFGDLATRMIRSALAQRAEKPPQPIRWWYMPPALNEMFRTLDQYDPLFGEAFYTGAWHDGFDHTDALAALSVPTVLIHANWRLDEAGTTLLGAMDDRDAARARNLIDGVDFRRVDAGHAVHFEKPRIFIDIVRAATTAPAGEPRSRPERSTGWVQR